MSTELAQRAVRRIIQQVKERGHLSPQGEVIDNIIDTYGRFETGCIHLRFALLGITEENELCAGIRDVIESIPGGVVVVYVFAPEYNSGKTPSWVIEAAVPSDVAI
ncbi:MAG TPA: hypothetical protein VFT59_05050 [Candidatus Saccharimonadales bacterium]|nr:hypothetical protein [Candidatus Saccharimonadales bacterium]